MDSSFAKFVFEKLKPFVESGTLLSHGFKGFMNVEKHNDHDAATRQLMEKSFAAGATCINAAVVAILYYGANGGVSAEEAMRMITKINDEAKKLQYAMDFNATKAVRKG